MKSNVCELSAGGQGLLKALDEVEKTAAYNHLPQKQSLQLRLLAEELLGMVKELLGVCEGEFWVENEGHNYELHVTAQTSADREAREQLLGISTTGKNAAAKGIMGKIRSVMEAMFVESDLAALPFDYICEGMVMPSGASVAFQRAWSLNQYRESAKIKEDQNEWDELEKSIVAKLADDLVVGIKGKKVDVIVKKKFIKNYLS